MAIQMKLHSVKQGLVKTIGVQGRGEDEDRKNLYILTGSKVTDLGVAMV